MRHLTPLLFAGVLVGCATVPRPAKNPAIPSAPAASTTCIPPAQRDAPPNWCALPTDVRAFVDDRDGCDHFRGEPWPESDSETDRARRKEILEGIRTNCAGTDARLAELKTRYASDTSVMALLSSFETSIER